MVLLNLLQGLAAKQGWKLTVVHFNHHLRGRSSDADEELVRHTAAGLGLAWVHGGANVHQEAGWRKVSVEMAARRLRHEFLARVARRLRIPTVALAHHGDDQVELFFLRLLRGAGGEGLAGMKWRNPSPADPEIELVRPLLKETKMDLREYARRERISFREDESNAWVDLRRNRIRHELLPLLQQRYQPALARTIPRLMDIIGMESEFVSEAARRWLGRKRRVAFGRLAVAVQRQCVQAQLLALGVEAGFDLIEQLRLAPGRNVTISRQLVVFRDEAGRVHARRVVAPGRASAKFGKRSARLDLRSGAGETVFAGARVRWQVEGGKGYRRWKAVGGREYFDADKIGSRIVLRHWRAGDRFQPIGMPTGVKLQDVFTNLKVPRARRRALLMGVASNGEVFWVEGLRIGERFKLDKNTVRRLKWRWAGES